MATCVDAYVGLVRLPAARRAAMAQARTGAVARGARASLELSDSLQDRPRPGELDGIHQSLAADEACGVEFAPELAYGGPGRHMMVNIPGSGIRVEFHSHA
jgi:hypothetical protein